ncbi:MAG: TVP38/TMEM64 family protein [Maricaulaceae bacterium]
MSPETQTETQTPPKNALKRFAPIAVVIIALIVFFANDGQRFFNIESLRENRDVLAAFVTDNFAIALLGFIALYATLVAISFPGASILSVFGGFLFGTLVGGFGIVIGATIGATLIFLAARYALGDSLSKKAGPYMQKFEAGLKENEFSYMFILRLIPAFPFFIVNLVPALFDVKIRNYVITTFLGIIPGALVYASVGAGVGAIFDAGGDVKLTGLMTKPAVLGPILGLIVLSSLPIIYNKMKARKAA